MCGDHELIQNQKCNAFKKFLAAVASVESVSSHGVYKHTIQHQQTLTKTPWLRLEIIV